MEYTVNLSKDSSHYLVNNRYTIYFDGVIYDTLKSKDIPQQIFKLRDFFTNFYLN